MPRQGAGCHQGRTPDGRLLAALTFAIEDGRIAAYEVIADPVRLRRLDLAVLS